jgi:hypothetical protein
MEQTLLQRVRARLIIEMLGAPQDHVERTLKDYIGKLRQDKTIQMLKEDYSTTEARDGGLFATFVEIEAWFKDTHHLLAFCFDAMPSTVEIIDPMEVKLSAGEFGMLLNDLQARLHTVDLALKQVKAQLKIVDTNALNVLRNFLIYALKQGEKSADELGKAVGLTAEIVQPYLDRLVADKRAKKSGTKYAIV